MAPNASASTVSAQSAAVLPHLQIVDRLVELPLVHSAWDYANERYAALKSSSQLVNDTLGRAEGAIQLVVTTVTPVLNKFDQPIHYADNLAVQGLDYGLQKVESIQKSSGELKDSTLKVVDQTKERIQAVKTQAVQTVQSKVQSVLTLPSTVVPLVDSILNAGENVLDYLLPEGANKTEQSGKSQQNGSVPQDAKENPGTVIRLVIVRMKSFSDKIQKRVVDYTRERWIPRLFSSVVVIKDNLGSFLANGTAGKFLANGHSTPNNSSDDASSNANSSSSSTQSTTSTTKAPKKSSTKNNNSTSTPNGDANKSATENSVGGASS